MIKISDISVPLDYNTELLKSISAKRLKIKKTDIKTISLIKKSIDARNKNSIRFNISVYVNVNDEDKVLNKVTGEKSVSKASPYNYIIPSGYKSDKKPVIAGFGPAGIFAALILAQAGAEPIILERGMDVDARKKCVEHFWKTGELDTECNVQFGEGGAGAFSDGKLTTGIKDIRIRKVLEELAENGAPEEILYLSKPHIGTDRLGITIKNLRNKIISLGGKIIFGAKLCDFETQNNKINSVIYQKDDENYTLETEHLILAVGHSARDIFEMLHKKDVMMSPKNFAIGVRIEHLQRDINKSMYGKFAKHPALGAADYKLAVHLSNGRSLYTFCMCPGGHVVAAASENEMVVTNGMSDFARDGKNANSALLVGVTPSDFDGHSPLAGMEFQRKIERAAFIAGGGRYYAPVSLTGDFINRKISSSFGKVKPTYIPGTYFASPESYLPDFICDTLRLGITEMGRKISGFNDPESLLTGIESRSSSPVRIERNKNCVSVSIDGLYPCGEGAGYAGGIISAAVDGIKCAETIISL